ncbi:MAG: tyrosine-type recombinase/integrase, partial [Thiotrichaceae bacterium]|nr:tyrosine-type recombinase/integrase [Thiotrichaceae bacterium]
MKQENEQIITAFYDWLTFKGYKPRGIEGKLCTIKQYLLYTEQEAIDMYHASVRTAEGYKEYLRTLDEKGKAKYQPQTINHKISNLRIFYDFLRYKGRVCTNIFTSIDLMKKGVYLPKNILSIEQMGQLLEAIRVTDVQSFTFKLMVELLYATGCRIGEIANIQVCDIDRENRSLLIKEDKTDQERMLPLSEYVLDLVKLYIENVKRSGYLFYFDNPRTIVWWINWRLEKLCKKLEFSRISSHCIRHSVATHLLKSGADIREVQEFLGHKDITSTEIYTRIFPEDLKRVVDQKHPRER